jgi:hypothetical protein
MKVRQRPPGKEISRHFTFYVRIEVAALTYIKAVSVFFVLNLLMKWDTGDWVYSVANTILTLTAILALWFIVW